MQQQEAKEFTELLIMLKKQCISPVEFDFKEWFLMTFEAAGDTEDKELLSGFP